MEVSNLLGNSLTDNCGNLTRTSRLQSDLIVLYFGASYCPPCRKLHKYLDKVYTKWITKEKSISVVYVSSDESEEEFDSYFAKQNWLAIPYEKSERRAQLQKHFHVHSIPQLVVLNANGEILDGNAREPLYKYGSRVIKRWSR